GEYDNNDIRRRKTAKLILDPGELKFVVNDAVSKAVLCPQQKTTAKLSSGEDFGTIVEYLSDEMPQYAHLRSYMLSYSMINLFTMLNRFPDIAFRVATDSFYINKEHQPAVDKYLGD
ncbi:hypothetical protein CHS0354_026929, partial [Potamilus streckersoni]